MAVLTAHVGANDRLICEVARLYLRQAASGSSNGVKVADVTYGRGVFWGWACRRPNGTYERGEVSPVRPWLKKQPAPPRPWCTFSLAASDLHPQARFVRRYDFAKLKYDDRVFDVVVLDPPYMHGSGSVKESISRCYRNNATSKAASHDGIIKQYSLGMQEALRVLKPNGTLWVKCQDEIESGKQRWSHVELMELARVIGFEVVDLFVLVQQTMPAIREPKQRHARKNHSYLLILRKPWDRRR